MADFTAVNDKTTPVLVEDGESVAWGLTGAFTGSVVLEATESPTADGGFVIKQTLTTATTGTYKNEGARRWYRARCTAIGEAETITVSAITEVAGEVAHEFPDTEGVVRFQVLDGGGKIIGTFSVTGATTLSALVATGNVVLGADAAGVDFTAYGATTGKFVQWDASDNAWKQVGDLIINTNKFTVDHLTGNTLIAGTLSVTGNLAVGNSKFNVTAANGNTQIDGTLGVDGATTTGYGNGTVAGVAEASVVEYGDGAFHKSVITFNAVPIGVSDDAGVGQWAAHLLYTMPTGLTAILGATCDMTLKLVDQGDPAVTWANPTVGTFGIGVTVITGASMSGVNENIIAETAFSLPKTDTYVEGPLHGKSTAVVIDDGTTTGGAGDTKLYINIAIIPEVAAQGAVATGCTLSGTVTVLWASGGDF